MPSDSENETALPAKLTQQSVGLLGPKRSVHDVLGGGQVADVLLWKNKTMSASLLIGMTLIWFIFEVMEYTVVTLICHICMTTVLVIFIWGWSSAYLGYWICLNEKIKSESALKEAASTFCTRLNQVASTFCARLNQLLMELIDIAYGKDQLFFLLLLLTYGNNPVHLFLEIGCLYILSVIGTHFSFLNLLYFGLLCLETLPFLYDRYEDSVDYFGDKGIRGVKKMFRRINFQVLNKISSRIPVKED